MRKKLTASLLVLALSIAPILSASAEPAYEYDWLLPDQKSNCVMFARYKVPSLPYNLMMYNAKQAICNSNIAIPGEIAIMPSSNNPANGHVAYVESVSGNIITILEGGYSEKTHINRRSGTQAQLAIYGYYNPGGLNGNVNEHIHTFPYLGYEQLHPHKVYKECTCGYTEYTGETKHLDSCPECNPPVASQMSVSTDNADSITESNATVHGTVSYSGDRPSEVGLYFGTTPDYLHRVAYESINFSKNPFNVWYDLNSEANQYLSAGTTYYYKFYALQDGIESCGEVKSFTTTSVSAPAPDPAPSNPQPNTWTGVVHGTDGTLVINSIPKAGNGIGLIPEGASCTVYPDRQSGNWYWVEYNCVSGYSYSAYISPSGGGATTNTRVGVIHGTDGTLVINSIPKAGNGIGLIPEGASCTVYPDRQSGNWYWVEYNGVSGYSYKDYIALQ